MPPEGGYDMMHAGRIVQTLARQSRDALGPWCRLQPIVGR
jgi:hypothetical protein